MTAGTATSDRAERRREWVAFLLLAFAVVPILSVIGVAAYGFAVWIFQMIAGPPGPPPP